MAEPFIVVVNGDGQDFFDLFLPDDVLVQIGFYFGGGDEIRHVDALEIAFPLLRDGFFRMDHGVADVDAFAADGGTTVRSMYELDLRIGASTERTIIFRRLGHSGIDVMKGFSRGRGHHAPAA